MSLIAFLHHIEMRIEGRCFEHLREREPHLIGQRGQMVAGDLSELVLDQVQIFDQQVALAGAIPQETLNRELGLGVDLAALGHRTGAFAAAAWVLKLSDFADVIGVVLFSHAPNRKNVPSRGPTLPEGPWGKHAFGHPVRFAGAGGKSHAPPPGTVGSGDKTQFIDF